MNESVLIIIIAFINWEWNWNVRRVEHMLNWNENVDEKRVTCRKTVGGTTPIGILILDKFIFLKNKNCSISGYRIWITCSFPAVWLTTSFLRRYYLIGRLARPLLTFNTCYPLHRLLIIIPKCQKICSAILSGRWRRRCAGDAVTGH